MADYSTLVTRTLTLGKKLVALNENVTKMSDIQEQLVYNNVFGCLGYVTYWWWCNSALGALHHR